MNVIMDNLSRAPTLADAIADAGDSQINITIQNPLIRQGVMEGLG